MKRLLIIGVLLSGGELIAAEDQTRGWGMDISLDTNKEKYPRVELSTQTLTLSPNYRWGEWLFALDVPYVYQTLEGEITVTRQRKVGKKRYVTGTYVLEESAAGIGDLSLSANGRLWKNADETADLSAAYIHKFDNGEDELAISSGSVDDTFELSFSYFWDALMSTAGAGRTLVDGEGGTQLQSDASYNYAYLDLSYFLNDYLAVGLLYNHSQSQYENKPDHDGITYSISLFPTDSIILRAYYLSDGEAGQPDYQVGAGATYSF